MGHKAHPLALRRASNTRREDHVWYSQQHQRPMLHQQMAMEQYLQQVATMLHMPKPRVALHYGHHTSRVYILWCTPLEERHTLATHCRVPLPGYPAPCGVHTMWAPMPQYLDPETCGHPPMGGHSLPETQLAQWIMETQKDVPGLSPDLLRQVVESGVMSKGSHPESSWVLSHMAGHLRCSSGELLEVYPLQCVSAWQDAGFLADEVVWFLERRVSFRVLKRGLQRMVEDMPHIRGVRVTCAGRVGGRSKKSQRARCDVWRYGATPLHVFSRELDYAQRVAHTPLGTMGVSVWLVRD